MNIILISAAVVGSLGLFFGLIISIAGIKLKVGEDPTLTAIKALMPGANCGACGLPGCAAFAEAVFEGKVQADGCPVGRRQNLAQKIADTMA
ncbi:MAG: hypothetical protein FWE21_07805 [Defluviitaleaceae bacterium]|nr:hypothetical protein [Defluviitaleaceae bacterium]